MKLNQKILVTSTSSLRGFIFRLEATTVFDVVDGWVKLGEGMWGACPSRELKEVATDVGDIDRLISDLEHLRELRDFGTKENVLYAVNENRSGMDIQQYKFNRTVDSLREGKFDSYVNELDMGRGEIRVKDNKPLRGCFNDFEDAITEFKRIAKEKYLD